MKTAFLSVFYPYRGGISQFAAGLYEALSERGDVRAFNFKRQYPGFLFPGRTQYVTEQDRATRIESVRVLDSVNPFSWRRTARRMAAEKPDVAVLTYWMSFFAPALGVIAKYLRRRGIKVVALVHNAVPHEPKPWDKPFARWFFKKCDAFVSMCDAVSADIRQLCPEARIMQRPHPLYDHFGQRVSRADACASLGIDPSKRNLLFFGLIREYKGLDILLDAFASLPEEYQLVVAGEPYGSFEKYQQKIDSMPQGCKERISLHTDYIADDRVPLFFSAADLCVLPYRSATQSGITAVSLNFEVPMVATRVGGLEESIERPGIGIMADEPSAGAVASAVERFFAEGPVQYLSNIRQVRSEMTWGAFARELEDFCGNI